ncbi:hypothetical protein FQA39_LY09143 [Lamprigera yunnana]|nr:hypothetical protein FQA39_LY09143 [Lamprigera yunnana]
MIENETKKNLSPGSKRKCSAYKQKEANNFKLCDLKVMQVIKSKLQKIKGSELILTSFFVLNMTAFQFYQKVSFDRDMAKWVCFAMQRLKR